MLNWPGRNWNASAGAGIAKCQVIGRDAGGFLLDVANDDGVRLPGIDRRRRRRDAGHHEDVPRIAATSSVRSIPTGHQVMQRPQPTHPDVSNWSIQEASLWVSHWR